MTNQFIEKSGKEKKIATLRKHPISLTKKIVKCLLMFAVTGVIFYYGNKYLESWSNAINIIGLIALVISLAWAFYIWITWFYDLYIITDERVIEIDQRGIFTREVREINLEKIQDVTYKVSGFLSTVFDIGNVKVHSPSGLDIDMEHLASPETVKDIIVKLIEKRAKRN